MTLTHESTMDLPEAVFYELRHPLLRLLRGRMGDRYKGPRGRDGCTLYNVDPDVVLRLVGWARAEAIAKGRLVGDGPESLGS